MINQAVAQFADKNWLPPSMALILIALCHTSWAQTYQITDFSDDYYAIITPELSGETNSVIEIRDAKSKRVLIRESAYIDIDDELDNSKARGLGNKISANIVSLPYGEHSVLIYQDFNFDNKNDIAIKDGYGGCYGGPSYQVYLREGSGFTYSEAFTKLGHGYCGFFGVNKKDKTLSTMKKSGAGWHQYSTYKVIDNEPVAVTIREEEYSEAHGMTAVTEHTRINGEMSTAHYEKLPWYYVTDTEERHDAVYQFELNNGNKMIIDDKNDGILFYAFADKADRIELFYDGDFDYDALANRLSFTNKSIRYHINDQGITVVLPKKQFFLPAKPNSIQGDLHKVSQLNNVKLK